MIYDVDYFIRKFEAIPEDMWAVGSLVQPDGSRCAMGHCFPNLNCSSAIVSGPSTDEAISLSRILASPPMINNGDHPNYKQPTPKARILAALHDIKELQNKDTKIEPVVKEKIRYVAVAETIKELEVVNN